MFLNLAPLRRDPVLAAFDQLLADTTRRAPSTAVRVNGYQTDEAYILVLETPGLSVDQIEVKVENGGLSVLGRGQAPSQGEQRLVHRELPHSPDFSRRFSFGDDADLEQASAELKDGLLSIRIPRRQPGARRIAIVAA